MVEEGDEMSILKGEKMNISEVGAQVHELWEVAAPA
jgi:hypothetical protein